MSEKTYAAAVYIRLSKASADKSNSIESQKQTVYSFLKNYPDIQVIEEKTDDGFSGTTFDRPAFAELLNDIKNRKINCVIVKDLSRFGRNYIECGRYIQRIFPFFGIRFIAVCDNFDSSNEKNPADFFLLPFRNLINDAYSRDISLKMRSSISARQKLGFYTGSFPPYGYIKKPDEKAFAIDEKAADTVRYIFSMRIKGISAQNIAGYLNSQNIPSPAEYKKQYCKYSTPFDKNSKAFWSSGAVLRILQNNVYTGVLQQGKEKKLSFKSKKRILVNHEAWICTQNAHPPIIPGYIFFAVSDMLLKDSRTSPNTNRLYTLSGLLCCGRCGRLMVRKSVVSNGKNYSYYICPYCKNSSSTVGKNSITEAQAIDTLFASVEYFSKNISANEISYCLSLFVSKAVVCDKQIKQIYFRFSKGR